MTPGTRPLTRGLLVALIALAGACGGGAQRRPMDGGPGYDAPRDFVSTGDSVADRTGTDVTPTKTNGTSCTTDGECISGACSADGVCCNSKCAQACYTCTATGLAGTCVPADIGTNPRSMCTDQGAASCGSTGVCDGQGACAVYGAGVRCQPAGCTGKALTSEARCDGHGTCGGATSQDCTPYVCGTNGQCRTTCSTDADCAAPATCNAGSCGLKPPGATCGADAECQSTFCAQGVCCKTDCVGTCKSCALSGSAGTCTNVPAGADPLGQCADQTAATCGTDGTCDGAGACRKYAVGTVCGMDACSVATFTPAGKCDATGACAPGTAATCGAYKCSGSTCGTSCNADTDCATNYFCISKTCQKKSNGTTCGAGSECTSGNCANGVCCDTACTGTCMACNLTGSTGTCKAVPAGAAPTPASQCATTTNSCGNDGTCDGAGKCRQVAAGTVCAAASCTGSTLTPARTCDGAGACRTVTNASCAPFLCNATACKATCSTSADCVSPNQCTNMSCGLKPPGATCAVGTECGSGNCAQGVCCNTACTGACMACNLTGTTGTCTPIPAGTTAPTGQCPAAAASTCGLDGTCDGTGRCRNWVSGTTCGAATCAGSTFTAPAACDGAGTCAPKTPSSCGKYNCDTTNNVCKTACTVDGDCVAPNTCNSGACATKPNGATCAGNAQCTSGNCVQGVCCSTACTGTCMTCTLTGKVGTCSNVPSGGAPVVATQCPGVAMNLCGFDGTCDGAGACHNWAAGTTCAAGSCTGSTLTPARTCDGAGSCRTVTSAACDPFNCLNATTCKTTCAADADCASPNSCNTTTMSCGKKPNGASCSTGPECNSTFCAQGVCCSTACSGTCVSCALAGSVGTCSSVPAGTAPTPASQCPMAAASTCGLDGTCDGNGGCRKYATGTTCAGATCSGSTFTNTSTCTASNTCVAPAATSCTPYICGTNACKTTCTVDTDCVAPNVCTGGVCVPSTNLTVALKAVNTGNLQFVTINVHVTNVGTTAVPLSELTIRYWYTIDDATNPAETANCDYSFLTGSCANIVFGSSSFVAVSPLRNNADHYFQFGFTTGAGSLAASGGTTSDMQLRWNKNNFSNFVQTNDYSFNNSTAAWTTTTAVTVYRNGVLVYGTEPAVIADGGGQ